MLHLLRSHRTGGHRDFLLFTSADVADDVWLPSSEAMSNEGDWLRIPSRLSRIEQRKIYKLRLVN